MPPPPPFLRLVPVIFAAMLMAGAVVGVSGAQAAQPLYAGPSTTPASAAPADEKGGPRWSELTPSQRKILAPLVNDWNGIGSRSKERWLDVAARFHRLPADEQQRATQRMVEWSHMTIAQRTQARIHFQETRGVSKEERDARWKAYQALPPEKKRELAKRAATPASAPSAAFAQMKRRLPPPVTTVQPKSNVVSGAAAPRAAAGSSPAIVPQHPGITTTFLNRRAAPPPHQRDGQPKIAAGPNTVDRTTLLPKHVAQAADGAPASAPSSSPP